MLFALVVVIIYGTMYRENPLYSVLEHAMIGVMAAFPIVADWRPDGAFDRNIITPMITEGRWELIIPVLIGLGYFTVLSRRLTFIYRTLISFRIGSMLGIAIGAYLTISMLGIISLAKKVVTDPAAIIAALVVIFVLLYYTFSQKIDSMFGLGRRLGYFVVFSFYAGFGATLFLTRLDTMVGWVYNVSRWPAILVVAVAALIILVDAVIRRTRRVEVPA
jgi:putative flippase GtrA